MQKLKLNELNRFFEPETDYPTERALEELERQIRSDRPIRLFIVILKAPFSFVHSWFFQMSSTVNLAP